MFKKEELKVTGGLRVEIKDKDGNLLVCNAHKKGEPCKAGVAAGQGHDAHVGKCAYHHP